MGVESWAAFLLAGLSPSASLNRQKQCHVASGGMTLLRQHNQTADHFLVSLPLVVSTQVSLAKSYCPRIRDEHAHAALPTWQ